MSRSIKKKVMALAVVAAMAMPVASFAGEHPVVISQEYQEVENEFIKTSGEILELTDTNGNISILVSSEEDEHGIVFHMSEDVSIWDRATEEVVKSESLEVGMKLDVFYHKNTPTTMSIPAQLTPDIVVIQDEEVMGTTYVGEFDEELVSLENSLKLNMSEETIIVNSKGEALEAEDIAGEVVMVFYTISTKSIPAKTTPSKVVVFQAEGRQEMISLRAKAAELGYKLEWNHQAKSAKLTKENQTIVITLGSVDYTLNKSLGQFDVAPELRDGAMYVPVSVLGLMN